MLSTNKVTIGQGGFGKCRVYFSARYNRKVLEKVLVPNSFRSSILRQQNDPLMQLFLAIKMECDLEESEKMLKKEAVLMSAFKLCKLDCCVEILGVDKNPTRIIMEYCEGGDLRKILDNGKMLTTDKIVIIFQIFQAISEIHKAGVIHGDLKCANIFLKNQYKPGDIDNIKVKIGDFGLTVLEGDKVHGGTPGFLAPEIESGEGGSFKSDIYSLGKIMLEIMTGLPVQIIAAININNIDDLMPKLPKFLGLSEYYQIVKLCLIEEPDKRPNIDHLIQIFTIIMLFNFSENDSEAINKYNNQYLSLFKLGETTRVIFHQHSLCLSNDSIRGYNNAWICDICKSKFKQRYYSFHCKQCGYDCCYDCFIKSGLIIYTKTTNSKYLEICKIGQKVDVTTHSHSLTLSTYEERNYKGNGWSCDLCKKSQIKPILSFHCKICEYDLCIDCCKENIKKKTDDVYKSKDSLKQNIKKKADDVYKQTTTTKITVDDLDKSPNNSKKSIDDFYEPPTTTKCCCCLIF